MKTSSAKAKGRNLQKWAANKLLEHAPSLEPDDVKSTSMGASGEDVMLSPAARKVYPWQIECKSYARIAVYDFYNQACSHGTHEPVVFIKQNMHKPLVIVDADYFVRNFNGSKASMGNTTSRGKGSVHGSGEQPSEPEQPGNGFKTSQVLS